MNKGRNTSGRFEKGHAGFKPRGAVSKKKRRRDERFNQIFELLDGRMAETIHSLSPKELSKLYLELLKLCVPKLARIPYIPDPPTDPAPKVTFNFIRSDSQIPVSAEKRQKPETLKL